MIFGEDYSAELRIDGRGMTGRVIVKATWQSLTQIPYPEGLPKLGDPFPVFIEDPPNPPAPAYPALRCVALTAQETGGGVATLTADYSTEGTVAAYGEESSEQPTEDEVRVTYSYGVEEIEKGTGWTWETANIPVDQHVKTLIPTAELTVVMRKTQRPGLEVFSALGAVNSSEFFGFPPHCVLLTGIEADERRDLSGAITAVYMRYRFACRGFTDAGVIVTWQHEWRLPRQKRDAQGNLIYDANGRPVYEEGVPGIGGWDKPKHSSNYLYRAVDFHGILGLSTAD